MVASHDPFGDGKAGERIAALLRGRTSNLRLRLRSGDRAPSIARSGTLGGRIIWTSYGLMK